MDTTVTPDRAAIRGAIEAMAPEFATLVAEIGDDGMEDEERNPRVYLRSTRVAPGVGHCVPGR